MDPRWGQFGVIVVLLVIVLVWLAALSERVIREEHVPSFSDDQHSRAPGSGGESLRATPLALYGNIVISHGLIGFVILGSAWYTQVPWAAFGLTEWTGTNIALGVGVGGLVALANEAAKRVVADVGFAHSEFLRDVLTPRSLLEWVVLAVVVLPVIAIAEELVFRGALIGVFGIGFTISPWILAIGSSVVFGIGHGLQGPGGIVVTGTLGFVLAVAFILSNSLLVVITAHYVVNLAEFAKTITHY